MANGQNNKKQAPQGSLGKQQHAARSRARDGAGSGRRARLRPERREQIDASVIGLCYWLIAQRIVQEAEKNGDLECPDAEAHDAEAGETS